MSAQEFHNTIAGHGADVDTAFHAAREQAAYEYGHGGYTGSMAEKDSYAVFTMPSDLSADDIAQEIARHAWDSPTDERPSWITDKLINCYDDKWGPAVAFRIVTADSDEWHFMGLASS